MPETTDHKPQQAELLGRELRSLRKNRGWTLTQLAEIVGCSVGYLSEAERGERAVSIKFLRPMAKAFDLPLGWFFSHEDQPAEERSKVVRARQRKRIGSGDDGLYEELLSADLTGSFETFLTRIEPGARSNGELFRGVEEEGYLVKGQLDMVIDGTHFVLKQGDSFRINGTRFSWANRGNEQTEIVWITSPPVY